jgi:hypothetical protein
LATARRGLRPDQHSATHSRPAREFPACLGAVEPGTGTVRGRCHA